MHDIKGLLGTSRTAEVKSLGAQDRPLGIAVDVDNARLGARGIEGAVCGGGQGCGAEAALIHVPAQATPHAHVPGVHDAVTPCT